MFSRKVERLIISAVSDRQADSDGSGSSQEVSVGVRLKSCVEGMRALLCSDE